VSIDKIGENYQCMFSDCKDVCSRETEYEVWAEHVFSEFETWLRKHLMQNSELFFVDLGVFSFCEIKAFENMTDRKNYYAKYSDADFFKAVPLFNKTD
jgi:hypothetical protein